MNPSTVIRHSDKVVYRSIGEDGVLLHVESGQYHELNAVGCRIWELSHNATIETVVSALQREFPDAPPSLLGEVTEFLGGLLERDLIETSDR